MIILYNIAIAIYSMAIGVAAIFNNKARLWVNGRRHWQSTIQQKLANDNRPRVWFHCASLGEFEQGRPVIEAFKQKYPQYAIVVTFFSPSGYEVRKNYQHADLVMYLPADLPANVNKFIQLVNPALAFFVKYEFWHNYIATLHKKNIPVVCISAIFRSEQIFFKWYGSWYRQTLRCFTHIFVQNPASEKLLAQIGIKNTTVAGDTRFDRVLAIMRQEQTFDTVERFLRNAEHVLVAGSTWQPDETLLSSYMNRSNAHHHVTKMVIAPHEISEAHINDLKSKFKVSAVRYSEAAKSNLGNARVLIIDNVGMLSSLYRYGQIAYIGGGFGKGIHNILEASVYGVPVLFGPNHKKFREAEELTLLGAAFPIETQIEFDEMLDRLWHSTYMMEQVQKQAIIYIKQNSGCTDKIMAYIQNKMLPVGK